MDNPQIAPYIARLQDADPVVRRSSAGALGKIGDASAVPALGAALQDKDAKVRWKSASALREIGDASAIPALIEALKDDSIGHHVATTLGMIGAPALPALLQATNHKEALVRRHAVQALERIGLLALPALCKATNDRDVLVRENAVRALGLIGTPALPALVQALSDPVKSVRLCAREATVRNGGVRRFPSKILGDTRFSVPERLDLLVNLRRNGYDKYYPLYPFPDTVALCRMVLEEKDGAVHKGAQEVLDWLLLLRASDSDTRKQSQELVRPAGEGAPETKPETLLRAGHEPDKDAEKMRPQSAIWQRLFGKRKGGAL